MAPALNLFLNFQASTGASEARPRYVLDCIAVKLHNMKAIPAIGLGTASRFSRAARTPEECYARWRSLLHFKVDPKWRRVEMDGTICRGLHGPQRRSKW